MLFAASSTDFSLWGSNRAAASPLQLKTHRLKPVPLRFLSVDYVRILSQFFFLNRFFSVFTLSCTVAGGCARHWASNLTQWTAPRKLGTPLPGCTFGLSIVHPLSANGTVIFPTRFPPSARLQRRPTLPEGAATGIHGDGALIIERTVEAQLLPRRSTIPADESK